LGSNSLNSNDPNALRLSTDTYFVHPEYDPLTLINDIGLIKLSTPITFNVNVAPIALAETLLEDGIDVRVSGGGATRD
uniref:trypsin-like serine protease n=1 Tax=Staphylococcus aureus TaxID=1280 RepID=UPI0038B3B935